jgi:hypothetical protein
VVGVINTVRVRTLSGEGDRLGAVYFPMTQAPSRTLILRRGARRLNIVNAG